MGINNITVSGNIGQDPRYLENGPVVSSIAVSEFWGGEKHTLWLNLSFFGAHKERIEKSGLRKGCAVTVSGKLTVREYEFEGQKRKDVGIMVNDFDIVRYPDDGQSAGASDDYDEDGDEYDSDDYEEDEAPF